VYTQTMKTKPAPPPTRRGLAFRKEDNARVERLRKLLAPEMGTLSLMTIVRLSLIAYEQKQEAIATLRKA
jgi:hypothetical protein